MSKIILITFLCRRHQNHPSTLSSSLIGTWKKIFMAAVEMRGKNKEKFNPT